MGQNMGGEVGQTAPDFTLTDGNGEAWSLAAHKGNVVALLFYPGDETPVCTKQLCTVRDRWTDYRATGAEVVGISSDSVDSHKQFADKYSLPLRLLSDNEAKIAKLYNVRSILPGRSARGVIVIDRFGTVRYRQVKQIVGLLVPPSDDETIAAIKSLLTEGEATII